MAGKASQRLVNHTLGANMGTRNMKFLDPIYWEDSMRVEAEVTSKKKTKKSWICEYEWTIRNQDATAVAEGHNI